MRKLSLGFVFGARCFYSTGLFYFLTVLIGDRNEKRAHRKKSFLFIGMMTGAAAAGGGGGCYFSVAPALDGFRQNRKLRLPADPTEIFSDSHEIPVLS